MLKNIPDILSPDLMKVLMEMGHGDTIVFADGNFPRHAHSGRVVDCTGHSIPELLEAVARFFPLDRYVEHPVTIMNVLPGDPVQPTVWEKYASILSASEGRPVELHGVQKPQFYEAARNSYAVVITSERELYANLLLQKGVV